MLIQNSQMFSHTQLKQGNDFLTVDFVQFCGRLVPKQIYCGGYIKLTVKDMKIVAHSLALDYTVYIFCDQSHCLLTTVFYFTLKMHDIKMSGCLSKSYPFTNIE